MHQVLHYHNVSSVAEIVLKESAWLEHGPGRPAPSLALQVLNHPFPYGLVTTDEALAKVQNYILKNPIEGNYFDFLGGSNLPQHNHPHRGYP